MLDSQENIFFELVGTWNGDLGVSDHLSADSFGAELSGGVPGAGDGMTKSNLLAMLKHGRIKYKKVQVLSPDLRSGPLDRCIRLKIALRIQLDRSRGQNI